MKTPVPFIFIFPVLLCFQSNPLIAQEEGNPYERIRAMKIAFITERLDLSPEEAEKFWPVYNDYNNKKGNILHELGSTRRYFLGNRENIGKEETIELVNKYIRLQQEDAELLSRYHEKFMAVLPPAKVMKLYISEVEFKNYLLQRIRNHKGQGKVQ